MRLPPDVEFTDPWAQPERVRHERGAVIAAAVLTIVLSLAVGAIAGWFTHGWLS